MSKVKKINKRLYTCNINYYFEIVVIIMMNMLLQIVNKCPVVIKSMNTDNFVKD